MKINPNAQIKSHKQAQIELSKLTEEIDLPVGNWRSEVLEIQGSSHMICFIGWSLNLNLGRITIHQIKGVEPEENFFKCDFYFGPEVIPQTSRLFRQYGSTPKESLQKALSGFVQGLHELDQLLEVSTGG